MELCKLGARVQVDRHRATVRYVGPVEGQSETWVGLDWDDEDRGKHNGSHNGKTYFVCSSGRSSGSLVRANKLHASASLCLSVSEALEAKYRSQEAAEDPVYLGTTKSNKVAVQLVGLEKIKQQQERLEDVCEAAVLDMCVSSAGPLGELRRTAPKLQELDLSGNLLADWSEIQRIMGELPSLRSLVLSSNRLALPESPALLATGPAFPALQRLVLNQTMVSFQQVLGVIGCLPNLEEVHLCGNQNTSLSLNPGRCQQLISLKVLALEDNKFGSWAEIAQLGHLPSLERLLLSNNRLQAISDESPDSEQGQQRFPALSALFLGGNQIGDWSSVDALDKLPHLRNVRLSDNPLPGNSDGSSRYQIIARIGHLTSLNGSFVPASERKDCELRYMREIIGQQQAHGGANVVSREFAGHPRMAALLARYGDVGGAVVESTVPKSLGASMVQIHLICAVAGKSKRLTKKLPGSLTVGKLKGLCERLFKVPATYQVVHLKSLEDNAAEIITDYDDRDLDFFDIKAGAEIVISCTED